MHLFIYGHFFIMLRATEPNWLVTAPAPRVPYEIHFLMTVAPLPFSLGERCPLNDSPLVVIVCPRPPFSGHH